ncbi:MAG: hypothetical protein L5655_11605 [Thermosediminibacteraceae bacterium]|nr:hypothetical protein [Thermosediminibacteraceae bacterium]
MEQVKQLLEVAKGTELEVLIALAVGLGLSRGEILGLKWSNVDLKAGTLTISKVLARVTGEVFEKDPKTEKKPAYPHYAGNIDSAS